MIQMFRIAFLLVVINHISANEDISGRFVQWPPFRPGFPPLFYSFNPAAFLPSAFSSGFNSALPNLQNSPFLNGGLIPGLSALPNSGSLGSGLSNPGEFLPSLSSSGINSGIPNLPLRPSFSGGRLPGSFGLPNTGLTSSLSQFPALINPNIGSLPLAGSNLGTLDSIAPLNASQSAGTPNLGLLYSESADSGSANSTAGLAGSSRGRPNSDTPNLL